MKINYLDDLRQTNDDGLNDELRELLDNDIQYLDDIGVQNEQEKNIAFYLDYFFDEICDEIGLKQVNKQEVLRKAFEYLKQMNPDDIDLLTIRLVVLKASNIKKAYPNTSGVGFSNKKPIRDIDAWTKALKDIYILNGQGIPYNKAFSIITEDWNPMVKNDFKTWVRYYQENTHEKYKIANDWMEERQIQPEVSVQKKVKTKEDVKQSLLGRLNAAEKLLYNFVHVWPNDVYNRLHQGLSDLKREIMMMRTEASMKDRIVRTASLWDRDGFTEGAFELRKIADTDITTEIEKALTGKTDKKTDISDEEELAPPMDDFDMPEDIEFLGGDNTDETNGAVLEGVGEKLPDPEEPPGFEIKEENIAVQPAKEVSVQDVLSILEPFLQKLREREDVRNLARSDMLLDELNIASHFPEIGEVQSKAIDSNIYMGTRIEKVVSKLKGGLKETKDENNAPSIEMDELKQPEEMAFEIAEEDIKSEK